MASGGIGVLPGRSRGDDIRRSGSSPRHQGTIDILVAGTELITAGERQEAGRGGGCHR